MLVVGCAAGAYDGAACYARTVSTSWTSHSSAADIAVVPGQVCTDAFHGSMMPPRCRLFDTPRAEPDPGIVSRPTEPSCLSLLPADSAALSVLSAQNAS